MNDNEIARQKTVRENVLETAAELVTGDRNQTYGSPTQNFQDTADVWNVILRSKLAEGMKITPGEVASMMIGLKLVRQIAQPKDDNWVDIAGYAACGNEVDVETGRIQQDPTNPNTGWGQTGDMISLTEHTPEPRNVTVFKDVNADELSYLVRYQGGWVWMDDYASPIRYDEYHVNSWQKVLSMWADELTLKVVR